YKDYNLYKPKLLIDKGISVFITAINVLKLRKPMFALFGTHHSCRSLQPAEICDRLKVIILTCVNFAMTYVDTLMLCHIVKSQSVIKLYIMFNILEVADKLFSSFGQDILDALYWTATEPRGRKREHFGLLLHLCISLYSFSYCTNPSYYFECCH
ncbi:transmembrane anterior posterior transformation protein 1 homolog, partial [Trichonephila inaurata madagascariensis]